MSAQHTPGPWTVECGDHTHRYVLVKGSNDLTVYYKYGSGTAADADRDEADGRLAAAAPELVEALKEGRRAIGDHFAPNDCYATGPMTGDPIRDFVQCPACSFIAMYDDAIAKATRQ